MTRDALIMEWITCMKLPIDHLLMYSINFYIKL